MRSLLTVSAALCALQFSASLFGQTVEVIVDRLPAQGPSQPAVGAVVLATQSPNQQAGTARPPVRSQPTGADQNVYVLQPGALGSPFDVTVRLPDHHAWVVSDLRLTPEDNQRIAVQLFHHDFPIRAPQCFALQTQYERLFRKEQQLAPGIAREEIEHRARLKYADGLLALPNPKREHLQSPETRRMLRAMRRDDYEELRGMMDGLFNLYNMEGFEEYVPSVWETTYIVNGQRVSNTVRLEGTHGTYKNGAGTHHLENVDIVYSDRDDVYIISGNWRFHPGQPDEATGSFRWKTNEQGNRFAGTPNWSGRLQRGPDNRHD